MPTDPPPMEVKLDDDRWPAIVRAERIFGEVYRGVAAADDAKYR